MPGSIVEAEGLVNRFGDVEVLGELGLVARSGEVTTVLGLNGGAGTTTFGRTFATLYAPTAAGCGWLASSGSGASLGSTTQRRPSTDQADG
jgi:ABC-type multidrug transport system ATPase subunit